MKSFVFALMAATLLFVACDVIPESDRLETVELEPSDRKVLLLEFTGYRCVNCPSAAEVAHNLIDAIPENIVVVAMHPEGHGFTTPENKVNALSSPEAMEYLSLYGGSTSTAFPTGVVNGRKFDGQYLQGKDSWMAQVADERMKAPDYLLNLTYTNEGTHKVVTKIIPNNIVVDYNVSLQMWLLESNIVASQASKGDKYVHNHVFRKALNPLMGDKLGNISAEKEMVYTFDVDSRYVLENCSVVAVLINTETNEVVQAEEVALGKVSH